MRDLCARLAASTHRCADYSRAGASRYPKDGIAFTFCQSSSSRKERRSLEITERRWDQIEPVVRHNPSPWVWMYKHWRYRLAGSAKPYPFYAESGPKFEARLNEAMQKLQREVVL